MASDDLHKLSKYELLQIIYKQKKDIEKLKEENNELNNQIEDRKITIKKAGSIAEASLQLNKIFEDAQKAADDYLKNVKQLSEINLNTNSKLDNKNKISQKDKKNQSYLQKEKNKSLALVPVNNGISLYQKNLLLKIKKFFLMFIHNISNTYSKLINKFKSFIQSKKSKPLINIKKYDLSIDKIEKEIKKQNIKKGKITFTKKFIYMCIIVIALTIIFATRVFNVLQVTGDSMEPTLKAGNLLVSYRFSKIQKNDIIAFYYNDKVLIKRVIATGGDTVTIDDQGNVYINSEKLDEPYIQNLSYGDCNITFPLRVPENEYFVLGDNREISVDSREKSIGTIQNDKILGKVIFGVKSNK